MAGCDANILPDPASRHHQRRRNRCREAGKRRKIFTIDTVYDRSAFAFRIHLVLMISMEATSLRPVSSKGLPKRYKAIMIRYRMESGRPRRRK